MCGIAGVFSIVEQGVNLETIKNMTDCLVHRGPDGEGQWINGAGEIGLGHRRLSIIDLTDAGAQPMHFLDRYSITFNGEIYNYLEIKAALEQAGHQFTSETDTEVLLMLFHLKKEECLQELDGMFAFAIWDEQEKSLFCARDRFGEKPFHYAWDGKKFIFASEIKALFEGGVERKVSKENMQDFLNHNVIERNPETFFENVYKLPLSHYLTIKNGKLEIKRYYDIDLKRKTVKKNDAEYAAGFNDLFRTSLKRRLRSDVPIGSSLSGGLDSSAIVCYMRQALGEKAEQKTFSARFDGPKDEGKWIHMVSKYAHTDHHDVFPNPEDIEKEIGDMVYHLEYPFGSTSICAGWYVMKMVKANKVTVLIDGQGADEYLSGYPIFKNYLLMQHLFHLEFGKFYKARKGYHQLYGEQYPLGKMLWVHPLLKLINHKKGAFYNAKNFKERLKYETFNRLQELLSNVDRLSMAFSIEVRLPFLSHELVEYGLSLPDEQLYHNGVTKYVLRNALQGNIPDPIVERYDKIGYEAPQESWMKKLYHHEEVIAYLKAKNYTPSEDRWRNYICSVFLKRFDS